MRKAGIVAVAVAVTVAVGLGVVSFAGAEGVEPGSLSVDDALAFEPLDPEAAVEAGWPATVADIEERTVSWYRDNDVAGAGEADLEAAISALSGTIADPPVKERPGGGHLRSGDGLPARGSVQVFAINQQAARSILFRDEPARAEC